MGKLRIAYNNPGHNLGKMNQSKIELKAGHNFNSIGGSNSRTFDRNDKNNEKFFAEKIPVTQPMQSGINSGYL
jgi:hypothetical protein